MEVVAIESLLTDFEVLELLQSPIYNNLVDFTTHQANRRQLSAAQKKLDANLQPHEKTLQQIQIQFNAGSITEDQFRTQCSTILQKTSHTTRNLSGIRADIAYSHKLENTIYIKSKLEKYLATQACRDQTQDHLTAFFTALDRWQSKWYLSIEPSELTMLINLRPVSDTLLQLVLNGFLDRVQQQEAREELIAAISLLPEAPVLEFDAEAEQNAGEGRNTTTNMMDDDDDHGDDPELSDGIEVGEDELDDSAGAQRDQDDDDGGANSD